MVRAEFEQAVSEGAERMRRGLPQLLATGAIGGIDVSVGVFALFIIHDLTGSLVLGGLAFSVGFIALTLAGSELFTENFLVPFVAVTAPEKKDATWLALARLWSGTLVANLLGGWVLMAIIMSAFPRLHTTAVEAGQHFAELGIGWHSFTLAMFAGMIITLMTWMEQAGGPGVRIVTAVVAGSLLAIGEMNHSIVASLEMFAGLIAGAPYGYGDWLAVLGWAVLGNMAGGIGLVTVLRMVQVSGRQMSAGPAAEEKAP